MDAKDENARISLDLLGRNEEISKCTRKAGDNRKLLKKGDFLFYKQFKLGSSIFSLLERVEASRCQFDERIYCLSH